MVGSSYDQKPYRRSMMETWGATVHRSPSNETAAGRAQSSHPTGSLGIAISEAVEVAAGDEGTNYALGSVLNHVLLHQTIVGQECVAQLELAGEYPDVVIGCVGGGSNFGGVTAPFVRANLRDGKQTRFVAAEPAACPTLTRGVYRYDFGDTMGMTPLMPMYTLGHDFVPPPMHAGGLRYHGDAPLVCGLVRAGIVEARSYRQNETFEAAVRFARAEGIIPAPEPAHAIRATIEEAEAAREAGEERVILFNLCGHGHFDLAAYDAYLAGSLETRSSRRRRCRRPSPGCRRRPRWPEHERDGRARAAGLRLGRFRIEAEDFIEDGERVLALVRVRSRARTSGIELDEQWATCGQPAPGSPSASRFSAIAAGRSAAGLGPPQG